MTRRQDDRPCQGFSKWFCWVWERSLKTIASWSRFYARRRTRVHNVCGENWARTRLWTRCWWKLIPGWYLWYKPVSGVPSQVSLRDGSPPLRSRGKAPVGGLWGKVPRSWSILLVSKEIVNNSHTGVGRAPKARVYIWMARVWAFRFR